MADSIPTPSVDPDVRDALSGLTGPDEVATVRNLRRLAHLTRLAYEAFLDEGFSDAQAMALVGRLAASELDQMDASQAAPVNPLQNPFHIPTFPINNPFITGNISPVPFGGTTTTNGQIPPRISPIAPAVPSTVISTHHRFNAATVSTQQSIDA